MEWSADLRAEALAAFDCPAYQRRVDGQVCVGLWLGANAPDTTENTARPFWCRWCPAGDDRARVLQWAAWRVSRGVRGPVPAASFEVLRWLVTAGPRPAGREGRAGDKIPTRVAGELHRRGLLFRTGELYEVTELGRALVEVAS